MFRRTTSDSGQNPGLGRLVEGKTYIGFVKNNKDARRMGRLQVWIPEMGGTPDDQSNWHIVNYASPFGGSSPVSSTVENSQSLDGTQTSYGWWAVPPDLENQVLCTFVNGESAKGFWFACVWQQNMNHMVPGIASNRSFQPGGDNVMPPVAEYNKNQSGTTMDPMAPVRPRFDPLHNALTKQGLYTDFERGPTSASARRESPAKVYGMLSPRGQQLYIDDDPENSYIRMRTRNGAQVLVHDSTGYVYINSADGNSWVEVSDKGVDVYSALSVSIRSEQDINLRADKNIHLDAGENITFRAGTDISSKAGANINEVAGNSHLTKAGSNVGVKASTIFNSANTHHTKASNINRDGTTFDNCGRAAASPDAAEAGGVSRMPAHEPWNGHPKNQSQTPVGDPGSSSGVQTGTSTRASSAVNPDGSVNVSKQTVNQTTGTGEKIAVEKITESAKTVMVGTKKVPENVNDAIKKASDKVGIDYGYMMAMGEQESGFRPGAKAPTSTASGLYQFTDGTWKMMVNKYPEYGYGIGDKADPEAQATMAALYAKENKTGIEQATGRTATNTDMYLGHFLGPSGAKRFLKADGDAPATSAVSADSAAANKSIFYNKDGSTRTVNEVYALFSKKIEPKAQAYNSART